MTFDQEVRDYLEEVARQPQAPELPRHRRIDASALREHFLERLRELERDLHSDFAIYRVAELFQAWSPKLAPFVRYLEALPQRDAPVDEEEALAFARGALDEALNRPNSATPFVDQLELARVVAGFERPKMLEMYTLENRLIRRDLTHRIEVTDLGRVFLRLRGQDAVRWLLTIELAQSQGVWDRWRASRELLMGALSSEGIAQWLDEYGARRFSFAVATLQRLVRLQVMEALAHGKHEEPYRYQVSESMRAVVQRVLDGGPWQAAVAALLDDERADVLPNLGSRAIDASIEQTRMIAHEVRNALVPVRHHIDALLKLRTAADRVRLESSRRGVVRVLSFIDEMVAASELLSEPLTSFEVGDVIRDALGWLDGGERVEVDLSAGPLKIRAPRSRLQRAISNLLLNALQATTLGQHVRAQTRRSAGMIEIVVDDGGPGVPEEYRSTVFHDGFTTRGGVGGSGFGLAYVRRVVDELRGKVWCEAADLGGARFVMALPEGEADK